MLQPIHVSITFIFIIHIHSIIRFLIWLLFPRSGSSTYTRWSMRCFPQTFHTRLGNFLEVFIWQQWFNIDTLTAYDSNLLKMSVGEETWLWFSQCLTDGVIVIVMWLDAGFQCGEQLCEATDEISGVTSPEIENTLISFWYRVILIVYQFICHALWVQTFRKGNLTHWGLNKMDDTLQITFSNAFSEIKISEFHLKFH